MRPCRGTHHDSYAREALAFSTLKLDFSLFRSSSTVPSAHIYVSLQLFHGKFLLDSFLFPPFVKTLIFFSFFPFFFPIFHFLLTNPILFPTTSFLFFRFLLFHFSFLTRSFPFPLVFNPDAASEEISFPCKLDYSSFRIR